MCSMNTSSIFLLLAKMDGDRGRWVETGGTRGGGEVQLEGENSWTWLQKALVGTEWAISLLLT